MTIRKITLNDYEEVVDMLYMFHKEVFSDVRNISPKYFYYKAVIDWINSKKDIIVAVNSNNAIVGFSMCYIDDIGGLTEKVYNCEYAYVKEEYRNTRASYLLYNNAYSYAKDIGLNISTNGRISNGVSKMMKKHFNLEERFINFEGVTNG